jgi:uncharacterized protein involved in response to NO
VHYLLQRIETKRLFFILASVLATVGPLLFLISYFWMGNLSYSISDHGRGMLFGFTSALITGYLAGKRSRLEVVWLVLLWVATRFSELFHTDDDSYLFMYALFGGHLAYIVAPKFLPAKKLRNKLMAPTLAIIALFPAILFAVSSNHFSVHQLTSIFTQLLTLLMFFMAGRMIPPLLVRANKYNGKTTEHRVQPLIEAVVMILILVSIALKLINSILPMNFAPILMSVFHALIATFILIRIIRWKPLLINTHGGFIWGLIAGYTWLAIAQGFIAYDVINEAVSVASLHIVTVGALGILSSTIMTYSVNKSQQTTNSASKIFWYIGLLSCSVLARYLANLYPEKYLLLLFSSALTWSVTFFLVAINIIASWRRKPTS